MCDWYSDRFIYFRLPTYLTRINGMKRLSAHRSVNYVFSIPNGFVTPLKRWYKIPSNLCTTHLFAGMEPRYTLIIHWDKTPYLFCPATCYYLPFIKGRHLCVFGTSHKNLNLSHFTWSFLSHQTIECDTPSTLWFVIEMYVERFGILWSVISIRSEQVKPISSVDFTLTVIMRSLPIMISENKTCGSHLWCACLSLDIKGFYGF